MEKYNDTMRKITFSFLLLGMFLLPWNFLIAPCAILLFLSWLLTFDYSEKWNHIREQPVVWMFIVLSVLFISGYFWSSNKAEALNSITVKGSLFIFPIVFAGMRLDYAKTKLALQFLLAGLLAVGSFMLIRSLFMQPAPGVDVWSYQELSRNIMHPSYLSLYYVIGIMICFHGILLRNVPMSKKAIAVVFVLFFCVMIFMLTSKTGILSLLFMFLFYIGYAIVRFRRYAVAGGALIALVAGFFIALQVFPALKTRLEAMVAVMNTSAPIDPTQTESNQVRLLIWQQDMKLISENPWRGTGTGDVQDDLMHKYQEAGMTGAYEKKLNAHSQYFQTGIALGLPGLVLLVGIFLASFTSAVRKRFGFAALFTILLAFNFIPESMLQMQAGTFLFGFLFAFILFAADPDVLSPKSST